jgi:hypothetical protein
MYVSHLSRLEALVASLALGTVTLAQTCVPNQFPIRFVDAQGVLRPVAPDGTAQYPDEAVFIAFDPSTPAGAYYVHVTGGDPAAVLSANDPMDRFVAVTNTGGVITLALPFTQNPDPSLFGAGLNGQGQSLRLGALSNAASSPCQFKVFVGNTWDLQFGPTWPNIVRCNDPFFPTPQIMSYGLFQIGSGNGTDVIGSVFLDADRDGHRDAGEGPAVNWQVRLVTASTSQLGTTDVAGNYVFLDVPAGSYTVELVLQNGWVATNTSTASVAVLGCANANVAGFGVAPSLLAHDGHTIGFWRNNHGIGLINQFNILPTFAALSLRNANGSLFAPTTTNQWKTWLQGANSVNMAYMLSAQLAAMHCNVLVGFVDSGSVITDPVLGNITIANLMAQAIASLQLYGFTPVGHPQRDAQTALKNALDNANNNLNWL